jgi:uncharacterized lipoprotein YajG
MHKPLAFAAIFVLAGCTAAPQDQVLKQMPIASQANKGNSVNCVTQYRTNNASYTTCN